MRRWHPVSGTEARGLERELARELPAGHVLKGAHVRAVARRLDCDDVAFELDDGRMWVVHLTWIVESDSLWPHSELVGVLPEDDA